MTRSGRGAWLRTVVALAVSVGVVAIAQLPDNATAAAVSLAITASGAVTSKIVVLLTPEEVDEAARKTVAYRAPGA